MTPTSKFILLSTLIVVSMSAGYLARRRGWASERLGQILMTFYLVVGGTLVCMLSVWPLHLAWADALLPLFATVHVIVLALLALAFVPLLTGDRPERGTFAIAAGFGNNGFTMGSFIAYVLFGQQALGLGTIYTLMAMPVTVLFFFPIARACSADAPRIPLYRLMLKSIFDWRAIGLPATLLAILFSPNALDVPLPAWLTAGPFLDMLMFLMTAVAYFAIGLRLHISHVPRLARMIVSLGFFRFLLAPLLAVGILLLAPWAPSDISFKTFLVVSSVPTAVTGVAVSNMFALRPQEASALFIANTLTYLAIILPIVAWYYHLG